MKPSEPYDMSIPIGANAYNAPCSFVSIRSPLSASRP